MSTQQAYPLSWPGAWARTAAHLRKGAAFFSTFRKPLSTPGETYQAKKSKTMEDAVELLYGEFRRLKVDDRTVVVSTNVQRRLDELLALERIA